MEFGKFLKAGAILTALAVVSGCAPDNSGIHIRGPISTDVFDELVGFNDKMALNIQAYLEDPFTHHLSSEDKQLLSRQNVILSLDDVKKIIEMRVSTQEFNPNSQILVQGFSLTDGIYEYILPTRVLIGEINQEGVMLAFNQSGPEKQLSYLQLAGTPNNPFSQFSGIPRNIISPDDVRYDNKSMFSFNTFGLINTPDGERISKIYTYKTIDGGVEINTLENISLKIAKLLEDAPLCDLIGYESRYINQNEVSAEINIVSEGNPYTLYVCSSEVDPAQTSNANEGLDISRASLNLNADLHDTIEVLNDNEGNQYIITAEGDHLYISGQRNGRRITTSVLLVDQSTSPLQRSKGIEDFLPFIIGGSIGISILATLGRVWMKRLQKIIKDNRNITETLYDPDGEEFASHLGILGTYLNEMLDNRTTQPNELIYLIKNLETITPRIAQNEKNRALLQERLKIVISGNYPDTEDLINDLVNTVATYNRGTLGNEKNLINIIITSSLETHRPTDDLESIRSYNETIDNLIIEFPGIAQKLKSYKISTEAPVEMSKAIEEYTFIVGDEGNLEESRQTLDGFLSSNKVLKKSRKQLGPIIKAALDTNGNMEAIRKAFDGISANKITRDYVFRAKGNPNTIIIYYNIDPSHTQNIEKQARFEVELTTGTVLAQVVNKEINVKRLTDESELDKVEGDKTQSITFDGRDYELELVSDILHKSFLNIANGDNLEHLRGMLVANRDVFNSSRTLKLEVIRKLSKSLMNTIQIGDSFKGNVNEIIGVITKEYIDYILMNKRVGRSDWDAFTEEAKRIAANAGNVQQKTAYKDHGSDHTRIQIVLVEIPDEENVGSVITKPVIAITNDYHNRGV